MLNWNDSDWNLVYWEACWAWVGRWVGGFTLQEEHLSWLRSWTAGCTWENGLGWIFWRRCTAASVCTALGKKKKRKKKVDLMPLRERGGIWQPTTCVSISVVACTNPVNQTTCALASLKGRFSWLAQEIQKTCQAWFSCCLLVALWEI